MFGREGKRMKGKRGEGRLTFHMSSLFGCLILLKYLNLGYFEIMKEEKK